MKLLILIAYFIVLITIGFVCRQKATDVNGFVLEDVLLDHGLLPLLTELLTFLLLFLSVMPDSLAGVSESQQHTGIGNALIGSLLAWVILGRRTRIMTQHLDSATMPQFFGERFQSNSLKIAASIIIFIFLIPYTASLYNGLSVYLEWHFILIILYVLSSWQFLLRFMLSQVDIWQQQSTTLFRELSCLPELQLLSLLYLTAKVDLWQL